MSSPSLVPNDSLAVPGILVIYALVSAAFIPICNIGTPLLLHCMKVPPPEGASRLIPAKAAGLELTVTPVAVRLVKDGPAVERTSWLTNELILVPDTCTVLLALLIVLL